MWHHTKLHKYHLNITFANECTFVKYYGRIRRYDYVTKDVLLNTCVSMAFLRWQEWFMSLLNSTHGQFLHASRLFNKDTRILTHACWNCPAVVFIAGMDAIPPKKLFGNNTEKGNNETHSYKCPRGMKLTWSVPSRGQRRNGASVPSPSELHAGLHHCLVCFPSKHVVHKHSILVSYAALGLRSAINRICIQAKAMRRMPKASARHGKVERCAALRC